MRRNFKIITALVRSVTRNSSPSTCPATHTIRPCRSVTIGTDVALAAGDFSVDQHVLQLSCAHPGRAAETGRPAAGSAPPARRRARPHRRAPISGPRLRRRTASRALSARAAWTVHARESGRWTLLESGRSSRNGARRRPPTEPLVTKTTDPPECSTSSVRKSAAAPERGRAPPPRTASTCLQPGTTSAAGSAFGRQPDDSSRHGTGSSVERRRSRAGRPGRRRPTIMQRPRLRRTALLRSALVGAGEVGEPRRAASQRRVEVPLEAAAAARGAHDCADCRDRRWSRPPATSRPRGLSSSRSSSRVTSSSGRIRHRAPAQCPPSPRVPAPAHQAQQHGLGLIVLACARWRPDRRRATLRTRSRNSRRALRAATSIDRRSRRASAGTSTRSATNGTPSLAARAAQNASSASASAPRMP